MSAIGLRVGPFEIVREARIPEPGRWYLARRTGLGKKGPHDVLVKLIGDEASAPARAALQNEYDLLRTLDDPRIPGAIGWYEGIGALAVTATEGVSLGDAFELRRDGSLALSPATLLDLLIDLTDALHHAHLRGRWHGHLTPQNVSLSIQGKLWVYGFGGAPGDRLPPPAWMAPERARQEPGSAASDQWSLGAIGAGLISGRTPWPEKNPLPAARIGDPKAILEPVEAQWPPLARLLRKMMAPSPAGRFPSLAPVRQELLALARKAGGTPARRELALALAQRVGLPQSPVDDEETETAPDAVAADSIPISTLASPGGLESTEERMETEVAPRVHDPVLGDFADFGESSFVDDAEVAESSGDKAPPKAFWDRESRVDWSVPDFGNEEEVEEVYQSSASWSAPSFSPADLSANRTPAPAQPTPPSKGMYQPHAPLHPDNSPSDTTQLFDSRRLGPAMVADLEPSEPTHLFESSDNAELAAFIAEAQASDAKARAAKAPLPGRPPVPPKPRLQGPADDEPSGAQDATQLFDASMVAEMMGEGEHLEPGFAHPTIIPDTDPGTGDLGFDGVPRAPVDRGPSLGDVAEMADVDDVSSDAKRPPNATIIRLAPWLVLGMVVAMVLFLAVRLLTG